jgi:hypothetical protein
MFNDCGPHHSAEQIHEVAWALNGSEARYGRRDQPNKINDKLSTHDANARSC